MVAANSCDDCSRLRTTLYETDGRLVCIMCLPSSSLYGTGALRAIRASVTGTVNIERRRRGLKGKR